MIDLHCHIIPGIDDGSHNLEESIEMARSAYKLGYREICCTSHYANGKYENIGYQEKFYELSKALEKEKILIKIHTGNELYLDPEGLKAVAEGKVNPMGNSNYLLVEAAVGMTSESLIKAIEKIIQLGYKPVLAHVERYFFLTINDVKKIEKLGVVLQVNLSSFSNSLKKRTRALLDKNVIHIVASDSHGSVKRNYENAATGLYELEKIAGKNRTKLLTEINPKRILEDCQIEGGGHEKEQDINSSFFSSFFGKFFRR